MLSDVQIKDALQSGRVAISDFSDKMLQPCSYDLRLGSPAYLSGVSQPYVLGPDRDLVLLPGQYAVVKSLETVAMSLDMGATIGSRGEWARQGMQLLHGPLVDPGWKGELWFGIYNASPHKMFIPYGYPFATLVFFDLGKLADKPYEGRPRPGDYASFVRRLPETMSLTDISQRLGRFERWQNVFQWGLPVFVALVAVVLTAIGILLVILLQALAEVNAIRQTIGSLGTGG